MGVIYLSLLQKLYNFLKKLFLIPEEEVQQISQNDDEASLPETYSDEENETTASEEEEKINVAKRTLMTRLYVLEQEITIFEIDFPKEFNAYMDKIEQLRQTYNSSLEEIKKLLTFEIDPELDSSKISEVRLLEIEVRNFIDKEVKFSIICKRLQRLITKLNILYNVSIFHFKQEEKQKVISQLEHAVESATKVAREFKECEYILRDNQLKERVVELVSYADYQIFKANIRSSGKMPKELVESLVTVAEFKQFDYASAFMAFVKDEISDLGELLPLVSDEECKKVLKRKLQNLLNEATYSKSVEEQIVDADFWNSFLDFESNLLEILQASGVEKEKAKVRLIIRMNINVDEKEVLLLPITNAYLSLTSIYSKVHSKKVLLLIKLLKNVSKEITYKEIYFLLLLFDLTYEIQTVPNELAKYVDKYIKKYPYNKSTIDARKRSVINSPSKEYVVAFELNSNEENLLTELENLNIDFQVEGNVVLVNSFYFNGLDNVLGSLPKYAGN